MGVDTLQSSTCWIVGTEWSGMLFQMATLPAHIPLFSHQSLHPDCRKAELLFCSNLFPVCFATFISIGHAIGHDLLLDHATLSSWQARLSLKESQRPPRAKYPQR
eukprot:1379248-Amphidinium_carterae.1